MHLSRQFSPFTNEAKVTHEVNDLWSLLSSRSTGCQNFSFFTSKIGRRNLHLLRLTSALTDKTKINAKIKLVTDFGCSSAFKKRLVLGRSGILAQ